jgi:hypothetical protein
VGHADRRSDPGSIVDGQVYGEPDADLMGGRGTEHGNDCIVAAVVAMVMAGL